MLYMSIGGVHQKCHNKSQYLINAWFYEKKCLLVLFVPTFPRTNNNKDAAPTNKAGGDEKHSIYLA